MDDQERDDERVALVLDAFGRLVHWGKFRAAAGFLWDLIEWLEYFDQVPPARSEGPAYGSRRMADRERSMCRAEIMAILKDEDGQQLPQWRELFRSDRMQFLEKATEFAKADDRWE